MGTRAGVLIAVETPIEEEVDQEVALGRGVRFQAVLDDDETPHTERADLVEQAGLVLFVVEYGAEQGRLVAR
jgi:hypothetical protein